MSLDYNGVLDHIHGHIPYNLILIKTLEEWKEKHDNKIPSTQEEKDQFRELVKGKSRDFSL